MAARLAEMEVRTLSDKLAVLDANAPVGMLRGLQRWGKTHLTTFFSNVEADALVEILSG